MALDSWQLPPHCLRLACKKCPRPKLLSPFRIFNLTFLSVCISLTALRRTLLRLELWKCVWERRCWALSLIVTVGDVCPTLALWSTCGLRCGCSLDNCPEHWLYWRCMEQGCIVLPPAALCVCACVHCSVLNSLYQFSLSFMFLHCSFFFFFPRFQLVLSSFFPLVYFIPAVFSSVFL